MRVESGLYRHYKNSYYVVYKVATHSESGEALVFYRCLYGDYSWWVRPLDMFCESVEVNHEEVPRFSLISPLTDAHLQLVMSDDVVAIEKWLTEFLADRALTQ
ncbi:MAG: DUF1653 domain-containing protein [Cellvibrio sp.]